MFFINMCAEVVMSQDNEQATKTVMTDGLIYYIVPCNKTVLKSNYIYCGYLILDNEQKKLKKKQLNKNNIHEKNQVMMKVNKLKLFVLNLKYKEKQEN